MKKQLCLLWFLCNCFAAAAQGLLLNQGDIFTYEFSNLPDRTVRPPGQDVASGASVIFSGNYLAPGERLRIELFENSLDEAPFRTLEESPPVMLASTGVPYGPCWLDNQGAIRLTMLSGSVQITELQFTSLQNDIIASATVFVPEPSTLLFSCLGLGALALPFKQSSKRTRSS